jgi:hypothetical protein
MKENKTSIKTAEEIEKPSNIIETNEYVERNSFESDAEAMLYYSYIEAHNYIKYLEEKVKPLPIEGGETVTEKKFEKALDKMLEEELGSGLLQDITKDLCKQFALIGYGFNSKSSSTSEAELLKEIKEKEEAVFVFMKDVELRDETITALQSQLSEKDKEIALWNVKFLDDLKERSELKSRLSNMAEVLEKSFDAGADAMRESMICGACDLEGDLMYSQTEIDRAKERFLSTYNKDKEGKLYT